MYYALASRFFRRSQFKLSPLHLESQHKLTLRRIPTTSFSTEKKDDSNDPSLAWRKNAKAYDKGINLLFLHEMHIRRHCGHH